QRCSSTVSPSRKKALLKACHASLSETPPAIASKSGNGERSTRRRFTSPLWGDRSTPVLRVGGIIVRIRIVFGSSPHPTHSQVLARRPPHKGEVMAVCDIATFKSAVNSNMRLLGLDLGEKTIGLAL